MISTRTARGQQKIELHGEKENTKTLLYRRRDGLDAADDSNNEHHCLSIIIFDPICILPCCSLLPR